MSQCCEILVRRQKFVRELRRKELQVYMQCIRDRLIKEQAQNQIHYEESFLQDMRNKLEEENYSHRSILDFLTSLGKYTAESLCNPHLMRLVNFALMHVLVFGENEKEESKEAHRRAKELLVRVLQCKGEKEGTRPLMYCFNEVFRMLQNQDFQMLDLWKIVALSRFQLFFTSSFLKFLSYLNHYPDDIIRIIRPSLEVLKNFTATIEGCEKTTLTQNDLCQIIFKVLICLKHYIFSDIELMMLLGIMQNIIKLHSFPVMVNLVAQILPELLKYLNELIEEISQDTIMTILEFLGLCLSGKESTTYRLIRKYEKLIPTLCQFLPNYSPYPLKQSIARPTKSINYPILINTLFSFCNIAACDGSLFFMLRFNVIPWMIQCSYDSQPFLKEHLSIFFYNLVVSNDQSVKILLQEDLLTVLNNFVAQDYHYMTVFYSLKTLKIICKQVRHFQINNFARDFNITKIAFDCQRLGLTSSIERLMISSNQEISDLASACLNSIEIFQGQHC